MENKELKKAMFTVRDEDKEIQRQKIESGDLYISEDYDVPKKKTYILLYIGNDEDGNDIKSFEVIEGRLETFEFIKGMIEYIDIYESKVLTDNVPYKEAASVYDFMKYVSSLLENDSFDIEDYNYGYKNNSYDPTSNEV